jgi:Asp-tRNA(Asn)/Glu-tRNA(Gln) amidotransferase A subunit family amidase
MVAAKQELYKLTATEIRAKILADVWLLNLTIVRVQSLTSVGQEITMQEYAASLLERIAERDAAVEAWVYLDPKHVIESAKALDAIPKDKRGPLHGVVIAVKDCILTKV